MKKCQLRFALIMKSVLGQFNFSHPPTEQDYANKSVGGMSTCFEWEIGVVNHYLHVTNLG